MNAGLSSREVVLLGVGHTNAHLLRMWRRQPIPDARLTCISNFPVATYSGMLPGVLAGQYPVEQMQIDLVRLCDAAGARLIVGNVTRLDVTQRLVHLDDHPSVPFDVLSIGIGSVPSMKNVEIVGNSLMPIKPMQTFLDRLTGRLECWQEHRSRDELRVVVVGGGAGGVELAFCLPAAIQRIANVLTIQLTLVHNGRSLVPGTLERTSHLVSSELKRRGVEVHLQRMVVHVADDHVSLDDGRTIPADVVIWATGAAPPPLLSQLELPTARDGFLLTRSTLQTTGDAPIFVVGDTGTREDDPTPKAGVYAVRQGPVLWENIHRQLRGKSLQKFRPQRGFLKLLNTGDGRAIGEYKGLSFHTSWAWKLKDWIDRRFMDKFAVR
ncbi:MAG: FAD-dependent oxidoreductase [Planctomycetaceae bacterium]|nr:FAD-dependent oxidoreductase [Planctomycetaceae bacterium]